MKKTVASKNESKNGAVIPLSALLQSVPIQWEAVILDHFDELASENSGLSEDISQSFLGFVTHSDALSATTKRWVTASLQKYEMTTWDIVFVGLEMAYPYRANTDRILRFPVKDAPVTREAVLGALMFYVVHNPKGEHDRDFADSLPRLFDAHFSDPKSVITADAVIHWFTGQGESRFPFNDYRDALDSAMDMVRYPVEIQESGAGIYVGRSPRGNPDYFWDKMTILKNRHSSEETAIQVVSLEASVPIEFQAKIEACQNRGGAGDEDDMADLLSQHPLEDPCYWPQKAARKTVADGIDAHTFVINGKTPLAVSLTHVFCWPDGSIPKDRYTKGIAATVMDVARAAHSGNTVYIHCLAGLGRTGVFRVAVEYALRKIRQEPKLSAAMLLKTYRETCRYGVQTPEQLSYLAVVCDEIDGFDK